MWGENGGQWRLWVVLCAPGALSRHSGKHFIVLHGSVISH